MWKDTAYRYIAFFDILGFKEMVLRNSHESIKKKLLLLNTEVNELEKKMIALKKVNPDYHPIKISLFSDSIVIFSHDNTKNSLALTIAASQIILAFALNNKIPIKGALSYGEVTADFKRALFFGKAIIDAYLLQDELLLYGAIFHHSIEKQINKIQYIDELSFGEYCCPLKNGNVNHLLIKNDLISFLYRNEFGRGMIGLKEMSSGHQRKYVDNSIKYFEHLEQIGISKIPKNFPTQFKLSNIAKKKNG
jgi:hypothetical protein